MVFFLKLLQVAFFTDQRKSADRRWLLSKQGLLLLILALSKPQTIEDPRTLFGQLQFSNRAEKPFRISIGMWKNHDPFSKL